MLAVRAVRRRPPPCAHDTGASRTTAAAVCSVCVAGEDGQAAAWRTASHALFGRGRTVHSRRRRHALFRAGGVTPRPGPSLPGGVDG